MLWVRGETGEVKLAPIIAVQVSMIFDVMIQTQLVCKKSGTSRDQSLPSLPYETEMKPTVEQVNRKRIMKA